MSAFRGKTCGFWTTVHSCENPAALAIRRDGGLEDRISAMPGLVYEDDREGTYFLCKEHAQALLANPEGKNAAGKVEYLRAHTQKGGKTLLSISLSCTEKTSREDAVTAMVLHAADSNYVGVLLWLAVLASGNDHGEQESEKYAKVMQAALHFLSLVLNPSFITVEPENNND